MSGDIAGILSGARAQELRLEVLSNNMANANTVGFKEDRTFYIPATPAPAGEKIQEAFLSGLPMNSLSDLPLGSFTNFEQGHLKETGNALDFAIGGEGFFSVQTPQGIQYTRKGNFVLNSNETLVTLDGFPVMGKGGNEIQISGREVVVDSAGAIFVDGAEVDALQIVDFPDKKVLVKNGDSLYSPRDPNDRGLPAEKALVYQGSIEGSNVDSVKMMTEMIDVIRGYESYQKILQTISDTDAKAVNELGKMSG